MDLDDTICRTVNGDYKNSIPNDLVVDKLRIYKSRGFEIVIHTSRNMRTFNNNVGKINIHTLPNVIDWLTKHNIPFDEVIVGKPWCGFDGFYVDDKSVRPSEFIEKSYEEILSILDNQKPKKI